MYRPMSLCLSLALLLTASLSEATRPWHGPNPAYQWQVIFRTEPPQHGVVPVRLSDRVGLTERGEVFFAPTDAGGVQRLVSSTRGVLLTQGQLLGGATLVGFDALSFTVTPRGTPLFACFFPSVSLGASICTPDTVLLHTGEVVDGRLLFSPRAPAMNALGEVAFLANFLGGNGIFTTTRGLLVPSGVPIGGTPYSQPIGWVAINAAGQIAFEGITQDVNPRTAIYTATAAIAVEGQVLDGEVLGRVTDPRITEAGEVAFWARLGADFTSLRAGIWTTEQGWLLRVGDLVDGSPVTYVEEDVSINTAGMLAWHIATEANNDQIGITVGRLTTVLLEDGDSVDGHEIESYNQPMLNERGQIAVVVLFSDKSEGVLLGTPTRREVKARR
jgi:hypothetical protein